MSQVRGAPLIRWVFWLAGFSMRESLLGNGQRMKALGHPAMGN
eukprot:COSAG04_NODE_729_length_10753_cov_2.112728_2_plen_43_part_00